MRHLLLSVILLLSGCRLGVESKVSKPDTYQSYEWRYDPYTGQPVR